MTSTQEILRGMRSTTLQFFDSKSSLRWLVRRKHVQNKYWTTFSPRLPGQQRKGKWWQSFHHQNCEGFRASSVRRQPFFAKNWKSNATLSVLPRWVLASRGAAADVARNLCADRRASALDAEELQQETARMCTARLREIDRPPALDEVAAALVDAQREFRDVRASVARSKAECALEEEALSDEIALERSRQAEIRTAASEMQAASHNIHSTLEVLTHESQELDLEESDERTRAELRNIEEEHAAGEASFEARLHLTFEQWEGVRSRACSVEVDSGFEGVNLKHGRNVLGPLPQSSVPCVHQADIAKVHPLTTRRRSVSEGVGDVTANQIGIGFGELCRVRHFRIQLLSIRQV